MQLGDGSWSTRYTPGTEASLTVVGLNSEVVSLAVGWVRFCDTHRLLGVSSIFLFTCAFASLSWSSVASLCGKAWNVPEFFFFISGA